MGRPLDQLEQGDFTPHVGTTFRLQRPQGDPLELVLVEVNAHSYLPAQAGRRQGFSLTFRCAEPRPVPQAIYRLDHDQMGTLEVFVVPLGPHQGGGMRYEAVFN
ncbi:MAG TPA: hypothetical protein VF310_06120 [Vicinamibacteria bacterium]